MDPSQAIFLVSATFVLADGGRYRGFVTPAEAADDIDTFQPQLFIQGRRFAFWGGMFAIPVAEREALYATSGRAAKAIFPLRFAGQAGLALGEIAGTLNGFYSRPRDRIICSIVPDDNEMPRTSPG